MAARPRTQPTLHQLPKAPTGIQGFDEITNGGLPRGRPTLVCGSAGCGKTLFALECLVRGATQYGEPGVFVAFEETAAELTQNAAALGFDVPALIARRQLLIDTIELDRGEIEAAGAYDLEGLFIRLGYAIDRVGAKRVVLDTLEVLFGAIPDPALVRSELRRLFRWLKARGVTAIVTAERGEGSLTRYGLEEYVADCVILLDQRLANQMSTRRLRVVKYRGSAHGTNEYPFLISPTGFSVLPITSVQLKAQASTARVSTGLPALDTVLGGRGFYRGSSILISGTVGTGKSSLAALLADAACRRGERVVYFAFEESTSQILRNMRSIGLDLAPHVKRGLLTFHVARPTQFGLDLHLVTMLAAVSAAAPQLVVIDPVTDFSMLGPLLEVKAVLTQLTDFLKQRQITTVLTSFILGQQDPEQSQMGISSIIDTWLLLRNVEHAGQRQRWLYVVKARGMAHSSQVYNYHLSDHGFIIEGVKPLPAPAARPRAAKA